MKKYNKKIALILALALTLAIALPALAVETNISGSYVGSSGIQEINVVVSGGSNVQAFLNPGGFAASVYKTNMDAAIASISKKPNEEGYAAAVEQVKADCYLDTLKASGDITTMPVVGVNLGGSAINVKATVNSAVSGQFGFASSVPSQNALTGLVFLEARALDASYGLDYDSTPSVVSNGVKDGNARYGAFDATHLLGTLNDWQLNWTEIDKKTSKETLHSDWVNMEIYPKTLDRNNYETDKEYKDAVAAEKKRADAAKKIFSSAFGEIKKQGQLVNKDVKTGPYKDEIVVLKKGTSASKQQVCTMKKAETDPDTLKPIPTYFIARLSGRLGQGDGNKKKWKGDDGFSASIIWTFETVEEKQ